MPVTLSQINAAVYELAPYRLAYEWDNVGLQIGDPAQQVNRLLIALEVNDRVIAHAVENKCEAILTHHPLIFRPIKSLRSDDPTSRLQLALVRANIGLIAAHTNLDRVLRGTNGALAEKLELRDVRVLEPTAVHEQYKFTVFVPRDYTPKIIDAINRGGGGHIGKYSHCTFRAPGTGTYVPEEGANPFLGEEGKFEQAEEDRLETVVKANALKNVLNEVMQAHPYEEVAYDVYPLYDANPVFGLGAVGSLAAKTSLRALAERARAACESNLTTFAGAAGMEVKRVAIITGSASSSARSVTRAVADVLITGELSYHNTLDAVDRGIGVITVGHASSEKIFADFLRRELQSDLTIRESDLEALIYDNFAEPFVYVAPPVPQIEERAAASRPAAAANPQPKRR